MNNETNMSRCEAITNIINSVAEEQKSLASILEAESNKIDYIIKISKNANEILEVNNSVQETIAAITKLEFMLASKLELFKNCLCICEEKYETVQVEE